MALEQNIKGIQAQNAQLQEMFLNLSRGQEELKVLLARNLAEKNSEDDKDQQLEQLQTEVEAMRTQMLGKMALIQGLARYKKSWEALSTSFIKTDTTVWGK